MATQSLTLSCDFETTPNPDDCRVWLAGVYIIELGEFYYYNNINDFMTYLSELSKEYKLKIYFHNLKFDGAFLLPWLLKNGYKEDGKKIDPRGGFNTLITDMGLFYQIKFRLCKGGKIVTILDSLKLIPMSVEQMAKAYGLEFTKGDIDHTIHRGIDHCPTDEEIDYLYRDVKIVADTLCIMWSEGIDKMTIASSAFNYFKSNFKQYEKHFPVLDKDVDKFIRQSYKGGYTYVNPKFQNKTITVQGECYDVNSLYPSVMHSSSGFPLPYGQPVLFNGDYYDNEHLQELFPLFIQEIHCSFELKKNKIPTIQVKKSMRYNETEYLKSSRGETEKLVLTSVDLVEFLDNYNVYDVTYVGGFAFQGKLGMFDDYINHWSKVKIESNDNKGRRQIAKLMLNSLYGRFAKSTDNTLKKPKINEKGLLSYDIVIDNEIEPVYTAIASFITAYARQVTQRAVKENIDNFIYCDTDSIHVIGRVKNIDVDPVRLGAWKKEYNFFHSKFIRAKTYIESTDNEGLVVKCAGMTDRTKQYFIDLNDHKKAIENFAIGFSSEKLDDKYQGLKAKTVKNGVILQRSPFEIN